MKIKLIPFLLLLCLQTIAQEEKKLADAFMQSLVKNNYSLLAPHIATADILNKAFYAGKANKAKLAKDFSTYTTKLKSNWPKYIINAKEEKISIAKVKVLNVTSEVINKELNMHGLNIMFKHVDRFGMIGLIYFPYNKKSYLLDLPNPLSAFTAMDSFRIATNLQYAKDKNDPAIATKVEEKLTLLLDYIKNNNAEAFTSNTVYRGDDVTKKWKTARDTADIAELAQGVAMMAKINKILGNCSNQQTLPLIVEKESEGVWYVHTIKCSEGKMIRFAFLKINDNYLLGDVDAENQ